MVKKHFSTRRKYIYKLTRSIYCPCLKAQGYDVTLNDTREYETEFKLDPVDENSFSDIVWSKDIPVAGQPIVLRDYQVETINNFLNNTQSLQEIATGAGKTLMTAALSKSVEQYGRSIVIVPNKSLVTQTEEDYINMGLDVGVFFGDPKEFGKHIQFVLGKVLIYY